MKLFLIITAAAALSSSAALAAERVKPTNEQINQVLAARGLPPLGGSRILHNDNQGTTTSVVKNETTIRHR